MVTHICCYGDSDKVFAAIIKLIEPKRAIAAVSHIAIKKLFKSEFRSCVLTKLFGNFVFIVL